MNLFRVIQISLKNGAKSQVELLEQIEEGYHLLKLIISIVEINAVPYYMQEKGIT